MFLPSKSVYFQPDEFSTVFKEAVKFSFIL